MIKIITDNMTESLTALIRSAAATIDMAYYLIGAPTKTKHNNLDRIWIEILEARRRNVKIRLLVDAGMSNKLIRNAANKLEKYCNYTGLNLRLLSNKNKLHCKVTLIDNTRAIIGSHNLTRASLSSQHDVSVLTDDQNVTTIIKDYYNNLWQQSNACKKL